MNSPPTPSPSKNRLLTSILGQISPKNVNLTSNHYRVPRHTLSDFPDVSTSASVHPETQHLPIPRATTAACEVIPPSAVSTPTADFIPWMSSGVVSLRTRITSSPTLAMVSASSGVNTTLPVAAPGDAGSPSPMSVCRSFNWRWWQWWSVIFAIEHVQRRGPGGMREEQLGASFQKNILFREVC